MINLIIKSGLGNQLFQYAYARFLQSLYQKSTYENEIIAINPYYIQHTIIENNDPRQMSLHHFKLGNNVRFMHPKEQKDAMRAFKISTIFSTGIYGMYRWKVKGEKLDGKDWFEKRARAGVYYTCSPYTTYPSPLSKSLVKHIFGYFQSEQNFHDIADEIIKELEVKDVPSEQNSAMMAQMSVCNSVCLHIRRGDYLNDAWKNLQVCDFDYYNRGVNEILNRVDDPVFYVFSNTHDDLEWIKKNYKFEDLTGRRDIKLVYVDLNNPDYEELRLMYTCKHFIISNSTFSWWGAFLSKNEKKVVCVPDRWNLDSNEDGNIYLKEWIKISKS